MVIGGRVVGLFTGSRLDSSCPDFFLWMPFTLGSSLSGVDLVESTGHFGTSPEDE